MRQRPTKLKTAIKLPQGAPATAAPPLSSARAKQQPSAVASPFLNSRTIVGGVRVRVEHTNKNKSFFFLVFFVRVLSSWQLMLKY